MRAKFVNEGFRDIFRKKQSQQDPSKDYTDEYTGPDDYTEPEDIDPYEEEGEVGSKIVDVLLQMGFEKRNTYLSGLGRNAIGIEIEHGEYEFAINKDGSIQLKNMESFNARTGRPTVQKINQNLGQIGSPEFIENLESILI